MSTSTLIPLRSVVRNGRRVTGRIKAGNVHVDGVAPAAVVQAIKKATIGIPSTDERAWIKRVELMRALLATSPEQLEIEDFGAGAAHAFDVTGAVETRNLVHKSLGSITGSSKPPRWAYLLFRLIRELKPDSVIEFGSCVGISASYEAAALVINGSGRLVTLEGAEVLATRSAHTLRELNLASRAEVRLGQFSDTLAQAIDDLSPIGFAFIDGHHVEAATIDYMEQLLPNLADESVLVFDDINWSDGMRSAWRQIVAESRFALTVDLGSVGIAVTSKSASGRRSLVIPYY